MNHLKINFIYICVVIMCWFAAKTKQRSEFKAEEFFNSVGINAYVPSFQTRRVWSDRIKKATVPAISGYVFFELPKLDFSLINVNPFTKNIVRGFDGAPAVIKENEIAALKKHLNGKTTNNEISFYEGQDIRVSSGPFMLKKGIINKVNDSKVIINIESININLILNKSSVVAA